YGAAGLEIVKSPLFALYEVLWLLRVFNFEKSKEGPGLTRAPGDPAAAVYVHYLAEVLERIREISPTDQGNICRGAAGCAPTCYDCSSPRIIAPVLASS